MLGIFFLMALPLIAIVGRPNVGKSTLFNRLVGDRVAVTSDIAGTTRDRLYQETKLGDYRVILVDTGGMEFEKKKNIEADVQLQARVAVEEAHVIFFVIDASEPLTKSDLDCAQLLRKSKKPVILIAHKADNHISELYAAELFSLGLGNPIPISSIHNFGTEELEERTEKTLKKMKFPKERAHQKHFIYLALVGKPNVGKSSIVNAMIGKERLIVSEKAGTTIDATDTPYRFADQDYVLIDTAGIRRRGKIERGVEKFGVMRSLAAISRSDVTCLILDYETGIANQDLHVSQYILEANKGLIIAVNKSDLMEEHEKDQEKLLAKMHYRMDFIPWAPVIFISALKKKNLYKIFELARHIAEERQKKISDKDFGLFVKTAVATHTPAGGGKHVIIYTGFQSGSSPPSFTFETNHPDEIHFSYRRFLENEIRRKFGFHGTYIRLNFIKKWD